jgi:hypothetical protein
LRRGRFEPANARAFAKDAGTVLYAAGSDQIHLALPAVEIDRNFDIPGLRKRGAPMANRGEGGARSAPRLAVQL